MEALDVILVLLTVVFVLAALFVLVVILVGKPTEVEIAYVQVDQLVFKEIAKVLVPMLDIMKIMPIELVFHAVKLVRHVNQYLLLYTALVVKMAIDYHLQVIIHVYVHSVIHHLQELAA